MDVPTLARKIPKRPRVSDPHPMLAWDRMVPESFVYVRLSPDPPDDVPIITATLRQEIVDFALALPGLRGLKAETRVTGIIFSSDQLPIWRSGPTTIDQAGGEDARLQRAAYRCWIRTDGDTEVRFPEDDSNKLYQVLRALADAYAIAQHFGPIFGFGSTYRGKLSYKLSGGTQGRVLTIADQYETWLAGDIYSQTFDEAFLPTLLEAETAGGVAGDEDEMEKLLRTFWRNNFESIISGAHSSIARDASAESRGVDTHSIARSCRITVLSARSGEAIAGATVAAVAGNGTVISTATDASGSVLINPLAGQHYMLLIAHASYKSDLRALSNDVERVPLSMDASWEQSGSVIGIDGLAYINGLNGRLNAILDDLDRRYLFAENISIDGKSTQPVQFREGEALELQDAQGARFVVSVRYIYGRTFLLDFHQLPH